VVLDGMDGALALEGSIPVKQGWMLKKGHIVRNCMSVCLCVCVSSRHTCRWVCCVLTHSVAMFCVVYRMAVGFGGRLATGKRRYFVMYPDVMFYYGKPTV
jgi:hypothetical protein